MKQESKTIRQASFIANSRMLALEALSDVLNKNIKLKTSVESRSSSLDRRDRAFLMEMVYGVLRFRDTLDWILSRFLKNPAKLGASTLDNIRIAAYQLFFMRVPDWAVVNEAVEIEKKSGPSGKPGLVNAVLRNLLRQKASFQLPVRFEDPVTEISINTSHPKWLVKRWIERFGRDDAALLAASDNEIPKMALRANTLKIGRDELMDLLDQNGISSEPAKYSPDGLILTENVSYEDLQCARGLFIVQDEASQLISYLLSPKPGESVLDACAAPGGKTTHIAQIMSDDGEIVAVEKEPKRLERIRENVEALGIRSVRIINADVNEISMPDSFDRILLDAPCSATGVIRRNPDVKYRHTEKDLLEYRSKQLTLLKTVSGFLKPGGVLVYSVCSTETEEGEYVIDDFLKTTGDFSIINAGASFLTELMNRGFLRTYPHRHAMDGFFGASLRRIK